MLLCNVCHKSLQVCFFRVLYNTDIPKRHSHLHAYGVAPESATQTDALICIEMWKQHNPLPNPCNCFYNPHREKKPFSYAPRGNPPLRAGECKFTRALQVAPLLLIDGPVEIRSNAPRPRWIYDVALALSRSPDLAHFYDREAAHMNFGWGMWNL